MYNSLYNYKQQEVIAQQSMLGGGGQLDSPNGRGQFAPGFAQSNALGHGPMQAFQQVYNGGRGGLGMAGGPPGAQLQGPVAAQQQQQQQQQGRFGPPGGGVPGMPPMPGRMAHSLVGAGGGLGGGGAPPGGGLLRPGLGGGAPSGGAMAAGMRGGGGLGMMPQQQQQQQQQPGGGVVSRSHSNPAGMPLPQQQQPVGGANGGRMIGPGGPLQPAVSLPAMNRQGQAPGGGGGPLLIPTPGGGGPGGAYGGHPPTELMSHLTLKATGGGGGGGYALGLSSDDAPFDAADFPTLGGGVGPPRGMLPPGGTDGLGDHYSGVGPGTGIGPGGPGSHLLQRHEFNMLADDFPALPGARPGGGGGGGGGGDGSEGDYHQQQQQQQQQHGHAQGPGGRGPFGGGAFDSLADGPGGGGYGGGYGGGGQGLGMHPQRGGGFGSGNTMAMPVGFQAPGGGPGSVAQAQSQGGLYDVMPYGPSGGGYPPPHQQHAGGRPQSAAVLGGAKGIGMGAAGDKHYGLLGLLGVIRMTDADLTMLALGTDLTTLGLNLNSPDHLYATFASPWSDAPARAPPAFTLPACYLQHTALNAPQRLQPGYLAKLQLDTLFYMFYSMPADEAQLLAADELAQRGWSWHREHRVWLSRVPAAELLAKTDRYERGSYYVWDTASWSQMRKDAFLVMYDALEPPPNLAARQQPGGPGAPPAH